MEHLGLHFHRTLHPPAALWRTNLGSGKRQIENHKKLPKNCWKYVWMWHHTIRIWAGIPTQEPADVKRFFLSPFNGERPARAAWHSHSDSVTFHRLTLYQNIRRVDLLPSSLNTPSILLQQRFVSALKGQVSGVRWWVSILTGTAVQYNLGNIQLWQLWQNLKTSLFKSLITTCVAGNTGSKIKQ